jgi:Uma2 family endonuclease
MPQGKHSRIQGEFVLTINGVVKPQRIACAFPELRCTFGGRSTVPDVAVFVWNRIPSDETGEIANAFLGPLKFCLQIEVTPKSPRIFCIA